MATAITIENLSKKYIIGHQRRERYTALRDVLMHNVRRIGQRLRHPLSLNREETDLSEFWALKDINLEIKQGDRVGIIGRNGAGKSTLLKILSRITEPTTGRITINGRVASLLEVGTGFHPELTGRENIFLNGAILGMSQKEIKRKFDEIVDFAEVEKFLDTPVKRYSSGMYVRLAFSVAAHLDPEILVVDEVLAVGDAQFQKKCLGKMEDVGKEGRTVIFVSHQMGAIQRLCENAIILKSGKLELFDRSSEAISSYINNEKSSENYEIDKIYRTGSGAVRIKSFCLKNDKNKIIKSLQCGDLLRLFFEYECKDKNLVKNLSIGFSIHNEIGENLVILYSDYMGVTFSVKGKGTIVFTIDKWPFSPGCYFFRSRFTINGIESDWPKGNIGKINVVSGNFYTNHNTNSEQLGRYLIDGRWTKIQPKYQKKNVNIRNSYQSV